VETIARIEFAWEGKLAVAEMSASRRWTCTVPLWREYLNHRIAVVDFSPAMGDAIAEHVANMAAVLGGRSMMKPRPQLPAGTVY
jgi:hypothetical protein